MEDIDIVGSPEIGLCTVVSSEGKKRKMDEPWAQTRDFFHFPAKRFPTAPW